jgi:2-polyprenyl-3-methyl-5-hydroxy-6-metoxy-1,4-benzoquinol methylase
MASIADESEIRRTVSEIIDLLKPPVPNPAWSEEVRRLYEHDLREIWDPKIAPHIWAQYHYLLDFYFTLVPANPPLDILDVGCAQATLGLLLAEKGHRVTALDIRPEFLEYAASRHIHGEIQFVAGNLFEKDLLDKSYDLVFANQIIEHVLDPVSKVRRLARHIRPGGRLIMTTPNWAYFRSSLPSYHEFVETGDSFQENTADADGHFFAYRLEELLEQVKLGGLEVTKSGWLETPFVNGHAKVRHLMPLIPKRIGKAIDNVLLGWPGMNRRMAHQLYVVATKSRSVARDLS